ncbi:helix-turn-helix domain-containing protein [Elizabethkingia argentiflava]|uniref:Helix-turn-helix domain-containing protein n=1 Tax=Elizabethkingia argenteiflava TaxID=2681556 RepID=A0A845PSS9_9FLAO|nr:helix-turn-helix transcriptional regulator [Elizabethkingia argenteiflava]NAW49986.1 helix-turn-helix domain-containing protein [Elizabethkingia argenteiflava]
MGVGTNLRKIRSRTKLSQQEVADKMGVSKNTYMSWESEDADIKSRYIPQLAELFNVEIKDLFSEENKGIKFINFQNNDSGTGNIIVITDKETAELFSEKMVEIFKFLKK